VTDNTKLHNKPESEAPVSAPVIENPEIAKAPENPVPPHRSPYAVIACVILALAAWAALMWLNGYVALGTAAASIALGAAGLKGRSSGWRNLGITAIICSTVLIVVLAAFLIVIKVGLS